MKIKYVEWNEQKNEWLQKTRGVSFSKVAELILQEDILDIIDNPNQERYTGQRLLILEIDDYVYVVPFIEEEGHVFLKTIIPSRKLTRTYLRKNEE